jgi:hypothetical protein
VEEAGRGRWKKFTAEAGRSSPRWVEEVERGTHFNPASHFGFSGAFTINAWASTILLIDFKSLWVIAYLG